MTESQLEAHVILAIIGIGAPLVFFLIGLSLTLWTKSRRDRVRKDLQNEINEQNRNNGKH